MDPDVLTCRKCESSVTPTATVCPTCGYDVTSHHRWKLIWGIPGMVMSLSVVFTPLGLPMLWKAYRHRLAAEGTVTASRSTSGILRGMVGIGQSRDPWPPWEAQGEFTRGGLDRPSTDGTRTQKIE